MAEMFAAPLLPALAALWAALLAATGGVALVVRRRPAELARELVERTRTWWLIVALVSAALLAGETATVVLVAVASLLAFREFHAIVPIRRADRVLLGLAYLAIPAQYAVIAVGWYGLFAILLPVWVFALLSTAAALLGETRGFVRANGQLAWALMLTVYNLGHLAMLVTLPLARPAPLGGLGLLLFVLVVVQAGDVLQYVWGRTCGVRPIVPRVSPGKTWAGFLGGVATTALLAVAVAPWLVPFGPWAALGIGALLAVAGFAGDILLSATKRDLGLKDTGDLLPGHGGILDRLDSLTLAAPIGFHVIRFFYGA